MLVVGGANGATTRESGNLSNCVRDLAAAHRACPPRALAHGMREGVCLCDSSVGRHTSDIMHLSVNACTFYVAPIFLN